MKFIFLRILKDCDTPFILAEPGIDTTKDRVGALGEIEGGTLINWEAYERHGCQFDALDQAKRTEVTMTLRLRKIASSAGIRWIN